MYDESEDEGEEGEDGDDEDAEAAAVDRIEILPEDLSTATAGL